jgi:hypothetical protein
MPKTFKRGDHVEWNSEAGRVRGVILKKITSDVRFKGYQHHASQNVPQYLIQSDKTDHVAIHKGQALRLLKPRRANRIKKAHKVSGKQR